MSSATITEPASVLEVVRADPDRLHLPDVPASARGMTDVVADLRGVAERLAA